LCEKPAFRTKFSVPARFIRVVAEKVVGLLQIRHRTGHGRDMPPEGASHIYYQIEPEYRCRGCASAALALAKEEAKTIGLSEILVTYAESNTASRRIVEKNGGEYVSMIAMLDGQTAHKYRIALME
jgi:predicted acetyltransferase